jgi:hypothetical protein
MRNADRHEAVPAGGLLILRDGERQGEEHTLSPHRVAVEHGAEVEVFASDEGLRDALAENVRAAVSADRTLGGTVEHARVSARQDQLAAFDGAEAVRAALLTVALCFTEDG